MKTRSVISELLSPNGSLVNSDSEMATLFNDYFSSVFTCEDTNTTLTTDASGTPPITNSIDIIPEIILSKITK